MPIYEFECAACGNRFEELVPEPEAVSACPRCGGERTKRVFSPPAAAAKFGTEGQRRKRDAARGVDRGGAMNRFKQQRQREQRGRKGNR